jgi:hypothetical protein
VAGTPSGRVAHPYLIPCATRFKKKCQLRVMHRIDESKKITADPISIAIAIAIILGATLWAGYVPARRAPHTDLMQALRYD